MRERIVVITITGNSPDHLKTTQQVLAPETAVDQKIVTQRDVQVMLQGQPTAQIDPSGGL